MLKAFMYHDIYYNSISEFENKLQEGVTYYEIDLETSNEPSVYCIRCSCGKVFFSNNAQDLPKSCDTCQNPFPRRLRPTGYSVQNKTAHTYYINNPAIPDDSPPKAAPVIIPSSKPQSKNSSIAALFNELIDKTPVTSSITIKTGNGEKRSFNSSDDMIPIGRLSSRYFSDYLTDRHISRELLTIYFDHTNNEWMLKVESRYGIRVENRDGSREEKKQNDEFSIRNVFRIIPSYDTPYTLTISIADAN